jgi:hypothetical protein
MADDSVVERIRCTLRRYKGSISAGGHFRETDFKTFQVKSSNSCSVVRPSADAHPDGEWSGSSPAFTAGFALEGYHTASHIKSTPESSFGMLGTGNAGSLHRLVA